MNRLDIEPLRLLKNNSALDDFCRLSPAGMHHLLYDAYVDKSPLRIRIEIENTTLESMPFFRLTENRSSIPTILDAEKT